MLCEPVTYEADAFQVEPRVVLFNQLCERYTIGVTRPGTMVCVRFSTCTRFRVGLGSSSRPPHW